MYVCVYICVCMCICVCVCMCVCVCVMNHFLNIKTHRGSLMGINPNQLCTAFPDSTDNKHNKFY